VQRSQIGTIHQQRNEEILDLFRAVEGRNAFYYGQVGNGKTSTATADIIELLNRGEIVWANWEVKWDGYDERDSFGRVLLKLFFGKKTFFSFKKENFTYFHPDKLDIAVLGKLVNVHIFIDEGQWIFNSHDRTDDPDKRKLILHGRHYCRSLNILSQRPSNVFKDMRSQIHVWYKCEKVLGYPVLLFRKTEYQDMKDDLPNEDDELVVSRRLYFMSQQVQSSYDTHAMRAEDAVEPVSAFDTIDTTFADRVRLLWSHLFPARGGRAAPAGSGETVDAPVANSLTKKSIRDIRRK